MLCRKKEINKFDSYHIISTVLYQYEYSVRELKRKKKEKTPVWFVGPLFESFSSIIIILLWPN